MPSTIDSLVSDIEEASRPGFRNALLARGQARGMIWHDGELPPNSPNFSPDLTYDLQCYAYGLLSEGLRLRELGGPVESSRHAFDRAASAFEAFAANGRSSDADRDFHIVIGAAAYHMAQLSARAYSLLRIVGPSGNFSPIERAVALFILRDFTSLESLVDSVRVSGYGSDASIVSFLNQASEGTDLSDDIAGEIPTYLLDAVDRALTDMFFAAMSLFLLALQRGEPKLLDDAINRLRVGQEACVGLNLIPQWWMFRIATHLFADSWGSSLHVRLPLVLPSGQTEAWQTLRKLFISVLLRRSKSEIDLWPSQIDAAVRAVDQGDNLVVSLPTSAGKTRIAEICILRCLAENKRVVFVTPLRALSAQTETGLRKTFAPLGKKISALYGAIGMSGMDSDALRTSHIVVATPEKLDFALRNDPSLLDDVGLLVFDEGHMIGVGEREIRYEVQIQRLLKRPDAESRRIVCLSAVLPDGDQVADFTAWLRCDKPGEPVKSTWRPTGLRFGEIIWAGDHAQLNIRVGDERPFVPQFLLAAVPPIGKRRKKFPTDLAEFCLASSWKLAQSGKTVLLYVPVKKNVNSFPPKIVELHSRGALASLLTAPLSELDSALAVGAETLGSDHAVLQCLRLGVAIHHGSLPTPFRKEVERLLQAGILKIIVSSPTLAQGLNLSASVVLFHSLTRFKKRIPVSEFKNVVGRAGRAYVDVEGLVLYPIFDGHEYRRANWESLIDDNQSLEMESGLVRLVQWMLQRMFDLIGGDLAHLIEYVLNNSAAWKFPILPNEIIEKRAEHEKIWEEYLATLDTALLSMLGEHANEVSDLSAALDSALQSSLWARRLVRLEEKTRDVFSAGLRSRAVVIWSQSDTTRRRGYFLAGVGLEAGLALDAFSHYGNGLLVTANSAILLGLADDAVNAITAIATAVFEFPPFKPREFPDDWRAILRAWLLGLPVRSEAAESQTDATEFLESSVVYRLAWAMEALRVRSIANGDVYGDPPIPLQNFELDLAITAVETGTINRSAGLLIQAGFTSRLAAIRAVDDTGGIFTTGVGLREWLFSDIVKLRSADTNWPTPETHLMWTQFVRNFLPRASEVWRTQLYTAKVNWNSADRPQINEYLRLTQYNGSVLILAADGAPRATLNAPINPHYRGVVETAMGNDGESVSISYLGPQDLLE